MSQIAERAQIGVGTIYRYFSSKEELINALYIDIKTKMIQYVLQQYTPESSLQECFVQILSALVYYSMENPRELYFAEQYENSPLITAATRAEVARLMEAFQTLFCQAAKEGLLKELPIETLNALMHGAVIALVKLYLSGTAKPEDAELKKGIIAIWDMLKK